MPTLREEIQQTKPFASVEQEAFLNLLRTADALTRQLEELFKPSGLSATQYNVLRILRGAGEGGLPCGQICLRMLTRDPDMTRMLDRLEKRDLISRWRDTVDRRVVRARISKTGLDLLHTLDKPLIEFHHRQLGHMGKTRLRQLIMLLEQARSGDSSPRTCEGH